MAEPQSQEAMPWRRLRIFRRAVPLSPAAGVDLDNVVEHARMKIFTPPCDRFPSRTSVLGERIDRSLVRFTEPKRHEP